MVGGERALIRADGVRCLAELMQSGRWLGVGVGTTLKDVPDTFGVYFVEDGEGLSWLRRDYGLVEIGFLHRSGRWEVNSMAIEMHRLSSSPDLLDGWNGNEGGRFERYTSWSSLVAQLLPLNVLCEVVRVDQRDFIEYRTTASGVSVMVVADDDARGDWPGRGDVWSVHLG